jgi:hypothetical protein
MVTNPYTPPELAEQLRSELERDEKLVWSAQPLPSAFRRGSYAAVIFGIPWTAFCLFFMIGPHVMSKEKVHGPPIVFSLFSVPFVLIGLGMLSAPFWTTRKARRTLYAITERRVITLEIGYWGNVTVRSFLPERLTSMERVERSDGAGDLIFEQFTTRAGSGYTTTRRGFIGVERVREVEEMISRTLLQGRRREA